MQFNMVDIFVVTVLAIGALRGLLRGLSRELADLIRIAGAFLAAYFLYRPLAALLIENSRLSESACGIVSFFTVLIVAFLLLTMLHVFLSKFMQFAFKGLIERVGGLLSGLIKGGIFAAIIIFLLGFWPHPAVQTAVRDESLCGGWIIEKSPWFYSRLVEHYPSLREFESSLTNSVPKVLKPVRNPKPQSEEDVE